MVEPVAGRLRRLTAVGGAPLFDDSYNANPASVVAAAEFLAAQPGQGWMVLGDMAELGDDAVELHADVGSAVRDAGVTRLFATGPLSKHTVAAFDGRAEWFDDVDSLLAALTRELASATGVNLLVKGSRSARMERVVQALHAGQGG